MIPAQYRISLKTKGSERDIPLVGASLWAAKRIKSQNNQFAFPGYTSINKCAANSASAVLNKWLKPRVSSGCVVHSFRHSLRDRLRAVECPSDIIDAIGGWTTDGVGQQYGKGHNLATKHVWIEKFSVQISTGQNGEACEAKTALLLSPCKLRFPIRNFHFSNALG